MTNIHSTLRLTFRLLLVGSVLLQPMMATAEGITTFTFASACHDVKGTPSSGGFAGPLPDADPLIKLREEDGTVCSEFTVVDPTKLQTPVLEAGDTLTVLLTIQNPDKKDVTRARAWVMYDPAVLDGISVAVDPAFSVITPGESEFFPSEGVVKIGASAPTAVKTDEILFATVTFRVKETSESSTLLTFDQASPAVDAHTAILTSNAGQEQSLLSTPPGALQVRITPSAAPQPASSAPASSAPAVQSSPSSAPAPVSSAASSADLKPAATGGSSVPTTALSGIFPDYRIENLRVTTQGTAAYLGWDILASAELAGYNVYYGATSGQYLQRKSIDKSETTLAIRGLPEGVTYYFAVRGVNAAGVETEFSDEVSVTIGRAETSTSPLSASMIPIVGGQKPGVKTDGTLQGETGAATSAAIMLAVCALAGTLVAARKQYAFTEPPAA